MHDEELNFKNKKTQRKLKLDSELLSCKVVILLLLQQTVQPHKLINKKLLYILFAYGCLG